ncbi:MAG: enoyl-CoA hydratase-related protein [Gammaproteobacteria bacterium]|nr:enoyl-CoA hydratase-related protein [Gammaproteobacteria bacterium]
MPLNFETLLLTWPQPQLLLVTLNRPEVRNALDTQMAKDLLDLFDWIAAHSGEVRCVVLTGAGEKAFCAGGDLKQREGMTDAEWQAQHLVFEAMLRALLACRVPVIAAVNGAAYGGGCEIAAACDFVYAAKHVRFAQTEVRLGIIPGAGGTQNLARAVGERRAKELIFSARPFGAVEAEQWGLVNRVCSADELVPLSLKTAGAIIANAPLAIQQAKRAIHDGLQVDLDAGLAVELDAYYTLISTEDRHEGVTAFNEKRDPDFQGR